MRRHKLNWIWIILLGLFVGSCEDYLDRSPDDGLSEDDVYKDYSSLLGFMDRIFQNGDILIFTHGINSYSNTYVTVGNLSDEYASSAIMIRRSLSMQVTGWRMLVHVSKSEVKVMERISKVLFLVLIPDFVS